MGWLTKFLKGSNHKHSGRGYTGKYGHDRDSDNHDNAAVITVYAYVIKKVVLFLLIKETEVAIVTNSECRMI